MNRYARAKQVECPTCGAIPGRSCEDMRADPNGWDWGCRHTPGAMLPWLKQPHKERVVKADGGE